MDGDELEQRVDGEGAARSSPDRAVAELKDLRKNLDAVEAACEALIHEVVTERYLSFIENLSASKAGEAIAKATLSQAPETRSSELPEEAQILGSGYVKVCSRSSNGQLLESLQATLDELEGRSTL